MLYHFLFPSTSLYNLMVFYTGLLLIAYRPAYKLLLSILSDASMDAYATCKHLYLMELFSSSQMTRECLANSKQQQRKTQCCFPGMDAIQSNKAGAELKQLQEATNTPVFTKLSSYRVIKKRATTKKHGKKILHSS